MSQPRRGLLHEAIEAAIERAVEPAVDPARARPRVVWFGAWVLSGTAAAVLVALLVGGHAPPPAPAFLVLAALLGLSTNHDVVFPNEYAASADLAVVLAAVVAFRHDAAFVGPLLIGLLAGPLDVVQWQRHAFMRMAWNSGDRGLAALAAAGAFAAVGNAAGDSLVAVVAAALAAVLAAALVDAGLSLVLINARGATLHDSWRAVLDIDALQFPLACAGAAAGFLVTGVAWWAVVPPMVALVLAPELVQARSRVPTTVVRDVLLGVEVVVACALLAPFVAVPAPLTICGLLLVAVFAGAELVVDARVAVPVVLGVVVVAAALAAAGADRGSGGGEGAFAGLLVGAGATAASWWCTRGSSRASGRVRAPLGVGTAAVAGAAAGALVDTVHRHHASGDVQALGTAVGAVLLFAAVALAVARGTDVPREGLRLLWAFPLVALGATAGVLGAVGDVLRGLPVLLLGLGAVAAAWCGATPWRSRVLSRRLGVIAGRGRVATMGFAAASAVVAGVAAGVGSGDARTLAAVVVVGAGDTGVAMALAATRQWRFAPRARARDTTLLVGAAVLVSAAGIGAADAVWWSLPAVVVGAAATIAVGRRSVARSDAVGALTESGLRS